MFQKFTKKTLEAIAWLRDAVDKLKHIVANFERIEDKVDTMKGAGDVTVSNPPRGSIVVTSAARRPVPIPSSGGGSAFFPVRLGEPDGGSAGDGTTRCSFTYPVYPITGPMDETTLLDNYVEMAGIGQRIVMAIMEAGEYGIAFYDAEGTLKLLWADEGFDQTNCVDAVTYAYF